jgi:hypothetical protein
LVTATPEAEDVMLWAASALLAAAERDKVDLDQPSRD